MIGAAFKNARAKATRCFSPPLNWMEKLSHYKQSRFHRIENYTIVSFHLIMEHFVFQVDS
jgi:hypothetical protein